MNRLRRLQNAFFAALLLSCCGGAQSADAPSEGWPRWLGPRGDSVWRDTGILEKFPEGGPVIRWRTPIGGGYAGPAVFNGKVYVTDRQVATNAEVPKNPMQRGSIAGSERVLCLNEADGKEIWKHEEDVPYTI